MFEIEKSQRSFAIPSFWRQKDIDLLLEQAPAISASLKARTDWLFEMIDWIRYTGLEKTSFEFDSGPRQVARMQYLLQLLDRNPGWKKRVAQVLRSIIHDSHGLELFTQTGLAKGDHFSAELLSRCGEKIWLRVPENEELHFIFGEHIRSPEDIRWMELLDPATLKRIIELFHFEIDESEMNWNSLRGDAEQALLLLSLQMQGIGLSKEIRQRLSRHEFQKLPFYQLPAEIEKFLKETDVLTRHQAGEDIEKSLAACRDCLVDVHNHLNEQGVSVAIVYRIERMEGLIKRMSDLLVLLRSHPVDPMILSQFLENLIVENLERKSVSKLISQNFSVLARRIVERTGESGEDYITRSSSEHLRMLVRALGGGWITAWTTVFKFLIYQMGWTTLMSGFFAGLNYSLSFLAIHFCHFTLGTKQPSMTASALAARMGEDLDSLFDEIVHLMRTQFTAILGNVLGVVPVMMALCWAHQQWFHAPMLSPEKAVHTVHEFSLFGPTPLYAYFTGILLWISSIFSGWADNWFVFHRLTAALAGNRTLVFAFGSTGAKAIAQFFRKHILGIAANISLGFLLGWLPSLLQLFDLQIEVRHVTLSSGALAAAMMSLPLEALKTWDFALAVMGIACMALLNVTVSFGISLLVAVKARKVQAPSRQVIYQSVISRLKRKPLSLLWPVRGPNSELERKM